MIKAFFRSINSYLISIKIINQLKLSKYFFIPAIIGLLLGIAFGNGFVFTILLFIPFIGIMLTLPIVTIASTIDAVKKLNH